MGFAIQVLLILNLIPSHQENGTPQHNTNARNTRRTCLNIKNEDTIKLKYVTGKYMYIIIMAYTEATESSPMDQQLQLMLSPPAYFPIFSSSCSYAFCSYKWWYVNFS
jgi:hypothetical protein